MGNPTLDPYVPVSPPIPALRVPKDLDKKIQSETLTDLVSPSPQIL